MKTQKKSNSDVAIWNDSEEIEAPQDFQDTQEKNCLKKIEFSELKFY